MLPLLLLVTFMAAQGLNADLIWYDELTSISHAGGVTGPFSPIDVMDSVREHSPKHTPLFFELVAGWGALVGWHHAVLRCLPLFLASSPWLGHSASAQISLMGGPESGRLHSWV